MTAANLPRYTDDAEPWQALTGRALTVPQARHLRYNKPVTHPFLHHERHLLASACRQLGEAHFLVTEFPGTVTVFRTTHGLETIRRKDDWNE